MLAEYGNWGDYLINEDQVLGKGDKGSVYKCTDTATKLHLLACKVMSERVKNWSQEVINLWHLKGIPV
jgi:predicted Ser/Thr protein kinase